MKRDPMKDDGLANLISTYRKAFLVPENLTHYSEQDFKDAQRRFVKYMLRKRDLSFGIPKHPVPQ